MNDNQTPEALSARAEFDTAVKAAATELIRDQMEVMTATYGLMLSLYQSDNIVPDPERFLSLNDALGQEFARKMYYNDEKDEEVRREIMLQAVEEVGPKFRKQFAVTN